MKKVFDFKPTINENSEKLYQKIKDKIYISPNDDTVNSNNSKIKNPHLDYIDRILLQDKKRIAENQKVKEELEKKELKECTFKPKIIECNLFKENKENEKNKNRFEELYKKGTEILKSKKNRTTEEIEAEKQRNECTFHPDISISVEKKIIETKFNNDIYNEKEYKDLYERLKHGRIERMIKEGNNDRYELKQELKKYIKNNQQNNNIEYYEEESKNEEKINDNKINENNDIEKINNDDKHNEENENEKKEGIPLLIIDVNIRQGVKKKIYVYEGDTPESLADKFSKENNLEEETRNKLQNLIHNHMVRLLTRIDEENQSVSEKSQTAHNQK